MSVNKDIFKENEKLNDKLVRFCNGKYFECPECHNHSLTYDEYYKRFICFIRNCGSSELSSEKIREIANEIKAGLSL